LVVCHILTESMMKLRSVEFGQVGYHWLNVACVKSESADCELSNHGLLPTWSGNQPDVPPTARSMIR
jgi:hypothetical protein